MIRSFVFPHVAEMSSVFSPLLLPLPLILLLQKIQLSHDGLNFVFFGVMPAECMCDEYLKAFHKTCDSLLRRQAFHLYSKIEL